MKKYVAVDVHINRQCRYMIAREKVGGGLVTIAQFGTAIDREACLEALNVPAPVTIEQPVEKPVRTVRQRAA